MKYKITKIAFVSGLSCVLSSGAFGQVKQGTVINGGGFSYQETIDPKVLEPEIASFTEVARRLEALNQSEISTACEKLDLLWSQIEATSQTPDSLFAPTGSFKDVVTFGNGSALRYWKIFSGWTLEDWAGKNAAPDEHLGNEIRPYRKGHIRDTVRLTHRYGVNVKLAYVPTEGAKDLGLTGHYLEGNPCVLGRLSSAVPTSVEDRFTPAIATKFFMDGKNESQVLIAQHDIGGQSWKKDADGDTLIDNNFYTNYLSNRLSFEHGVTSGFGAFSRFFYTAQYFSRHIFGLDYIFDPRELQANHLGEQGIDGQKVSGAKGPRFVWMVAPSEARKQEFRDKADNNLDFRHHFLEMNDQIEVGKTPLYHVYASDTWTYNPVEEGTLIGQFIIASDFVVSEAADVRLFYRHAIQLQKIPETQGKDNPYTKDYGFADWTDETFTHNCALGATQKEVWPKNLTSKYDKEHLYPGIDFSKGSLDGTFLKGATIDPRTVRFSTDREWCLKNFVEDKFGGKIPEYLKSL